MNSLLTPEQASGDNYEKTITLFKIFLHGFNNSVDEESLKSILQKATYFIFMLGEWDLS